MQPGAQLRKRTGSGNSFGLRRPDLQCCVARVGVSCATIVCRVFSSGVINSLSSRNLMESDRLSNGEK